MCVGGRERWGGFIVDIYTYMHVHTHTHTYTHIHTQYVICIHAHAHVYICIVNISMKFIMNIYTMYEACIYISCVLVPICVCVHAYKKRYLSAEQKNSMSPRRNNVRMHIDVAIAI